MWKPQPTLMGFIAVTMVSCSQADPMARLPDTSADQSQNNATAQVVKLHPIFDDLYVCSEHRKGELAFPGDALGQDCLVVGGFDAEATFGFPRLYSGQGERNSDWYGWQQPVLAPASGTVREVHINPHVNEPGRMTPGRATSVVMELNSGGGIVMAHFSSVDVAKGDAVFAGQPIGTVGNNGYSRNPHIHIGAVDDAGSPVQISWDLN